MSSHREIFRSSAIIGGSSAINIAIGIIQVKVLAVLLGPAGIGLLGIYQSIMTVGTTAAGCGLADSGVRQLAISKESEETLGIVRRALLFANTCLGLLGLLAIWTFSEPIASVAFNGVVKASDVRWLGVGVFLGLVATSQTTLLRGLRRIGDLARVTVLSALFTAVAGILCIYIWRESGIIWFVIIAPAMSVVVASYFTRRLKTVSANYNWAQVRSQCLSMMKFGVPIMIASLLNVSALFLSRWLIIDELGVEANGQFEATWMISMTYLGFILGAMAADYYPRLTAAIGRPEAAIKLVNEQGEMAMLLGGAVILAMITLAPFVVSILFSSAFEPAGEVLRWQMLGSVLKLLTWPMGFVVLASGRSGLFIYTQFVWNAVFMLCLYFLLSRIGLLAVGVGFCVAYLVGGINVGFVAKKLIGFAPNRFNLYMATLLVIMGGTIIYLASLSLMYSLFFGGLATFLIAACSFYRIDQLVDITGSLREYFS